jgi:hypothetical protein
MEAGVSCYHSGTRGGGAGERAAVNSDEKETLREPDRVRRMPHEEAAVCDEVWLENLASP